MNFFFLILGAMATIALCTNALAQFKENPAPWVKGQGKGLFEVGELIASDNFRNLDDWIVQIDNVDGFPDHYVKATNRSLDCFLPGRGGTIWFKRKLKTRVTITYDVLCPTPKTPIKGLRPTDINNFWMATDPGDSEEGLFDPESYTGNFGSYDKLHGYYASTGGGKNTTTRMRRYPRQVDDQPAPHLALKDKDGNKEFLITPDRLMTVQLVAFDDLVQYIVDGKLVYEITRGETIQIETLDQKGKRVTKDGIYDLDPFPVYEEGYFGFRMVGTHHIYSNFRVHELEPIAGANLDRERVEVSTLDALRETMRKSNQHVIMKPGAYIIDDMEGRLIAFEMSGSDNYFDLTGVTIEMPIDTLDQMTSNRPERVRGENRRERRRRSETGSFVLRGDRITLKGGTFINTYHDKKTEVTEFGPYNRDPANFPEKGVTEMRIKGDDVRVIGNRMIVRGSYPYGYGNIYGIGGGAAVGLRKHCGILITGDRTIIDRCYVKMEAFGHAIFVQGGDEITVRNSTVEGEVRPSNDLYTETHKGDLAKKFNYEIQWPETVEGLPIPRDHMMNLCEDGIRAYTGTGHMTVDNCRVHKARGGIKLYMAKSADVSNCLVTDCVIQGYSLPSRGTLTRSSGNAAYGPLLYIHNDSTSSQRIDLEVLPSPHGLGDHPLAAIKGHGHRINFTTPDTSNPGTLRPIIVGYPLRFDFLSIDFPEIPEGMEELFAEHAPDRYRAERISLNNQTPYPVVLGKLSADNRVASLGEIRDEGKDNRKLSHGKGRSGGDLEPAKIGVSQWDQSRKTKVRKSHVAVQVSEASP